jgi:hypothetical protein
MHANLRPNDNVYLTAYRGNSYIRLNLMINSSGEMWKETPEAVPASSNLQGTAIGFTSSAAVLNAFTPS